MSGDYTRFTFNPAKGFSGVHKQQGRVSLDSDFNEFEEILDRRSRAETYDVVGQAVVPITTPHGFEIGVSGGKLTIGLGRAYVDGILAECFGDLSNPGTTVRDDRLGGVHGPNPVAYDQQPFFYQPSFPALSSAAGAINLVYLDVWQREVTVYEDDALREPALNGPDTATRVQTAWQVKAMQGADASSCATPPPAWAALTAASTARLSTQAAPVAPEAGPCIINPAGGYTGLENRLYRVEIHQAGTLGGATKAQFKWSRDNASLTARVLSITKSGAQSVITVSSTGRDAWMRFEQGDHIELLDDFVELAMRETGTGGPMARVLTVNQATGEILVDQDLSGFAIVAARHPRIRRWDIDLATELLVRDVNNGVAIKLEEGITITFGGAAADTLHAGDYWVFAARTADGTIETLVDAPPRGILHHYARLALVTSGKLPTVLRDCRHFWPPRSCCTFVVVPGESIQRALDGLPDEGGCVCLKVGTHVITEPIRIVKSNVTLHGETIGARVVRTNGPGMLEVGSPNAGTIDDVTVQHIRFEAGSEGGFAWGMIAASRVDDFTLEGCELIMAAGRDGLPVNPAPGVYLETVAGARIADNELERQLIGLLALDSTRIEVSHNDFLGPLQSAPDGLGLTVGDTGILITSLGGDHHRIERNRIESYAAGIVLSSGVGANSEHSTIAANQVVRMRTAPSASDPRFAIDVSADHATVAGNIVNLPSELCGGISVVGLHALVADNHVDSSARPADSEAPIGIRLGISLETDFPFFSLSSDDGVIRGNRLTGWQNAIVLLELRNAEVAGNQIEDSPESATFAILLSNARSSRVAGNQIAGSQWGILITGGSGNRLTDNVVRDGGSGLTAWIETGLDVTHNRVENMTLVGFLGGALVATTHLAYNRFEFCGYQGGAGIGILYALGAVQIESCEVMNTGVSPDGNQILRPAYGIVGLLLLECLVHGNLVTYSDPTFFLNDLNPEDRALLLMGLREVALFAPVSPPVPSGETLGFCAQVLDNKFIGPGLSALVEFLSQRVNDSLFLRFKRVTFNDNYCLHSSPVATQTSQQKQRATVQIRCTAALVSGNQIESPRRIPAVNFNDSDIRHVFIGNVVTEFAVGFAPFPTPQANFNLQR